jgi:hypothetical protein
MKKSEWYDLQGKVFNDIVTLTRKKNADYTAGVDDAFANFRMAEEIGMTPLHGLVLRMGDKWQRVKSYMKGGNLQVEGEGIEDAFRDMIGYSVLAIGILTEMKGDKHE